SLANSTRFVRLTRRSIFHQDVKIVQSPIMKVSQHHSYEHNRHQKEPLMQGQSNQIPLGVDSKSQPKRIHVNLEEEFIYLILDNISVLELAMGKYNAPEKSQQKSTRIYACIAYFSLFVCMSKLI